MTPTQITERAAELAEQWQNGNLTHVADELCDGSGGTLERVMLTAETFRHLTAHDRDTLTRLIAEKIDR